MANHTGDESFAVLRTEDGDFDFTEVARLLAEPLEMAVADLVQQLPHRSGILAEELTEGLAKECVALLIHEGIAATVIPQSAVIDPPDVVTLRSAGLGDEVFFYVAADQRGVVKWPAIVWIDFISILEPTTEEYEDWELVGDESPSVQRSKKCRTTSKKALYVDLVTYEPWMLMRIPLDKFEFAATGLPMFPNRWQNLVALAAAIASRATAAQLGPGLQSVRSAELPQEHRLKGPSLYEGYLRWQLTRLFLADKDETL